MLGNGAQVSFKLASEGVFVGGDEVYKYVKSEQTVNCVISNSFGVETWTNRSIIWIKTDVKSYIDSNVEHQEHHEQIPNERKAVSRQ